MEIFVELLDGIEKKYKTLDILPDEERRRWIAGKEAKEFGLLKEMKTKLPGKPEDLEFVVTNPEATLYVAIEVMNERYGGTTKYEFKKSIETYNAIKESYGAIWTSKAKGKQTSELELSDFIGRIKDAWPLMFAQEQRRELRGMVIVVNNLIDYMQTVRGKQLFRGMDF